MGGGGGGMGGGPGGPPPGDMGGGGAEMSGARGGIAESQLPPAMIRLQFTNTGTVPLEFEIRDFTSELGNFVVNPSRYALAPGETASPDGLTSRLGVTSAEIPITLVLRTKGQTVSRTLVLTAVKDPTPTPPPST